MPDPNSADVAVLVMQKELEQMSKFFDKLDAAIVKISELSTSMTKMLAVHDERLDQQQEDNARARSSIETLANDVYRSLRESQEKIASQGYDITALKKSDEEKTKVISDLNVWRWKIMGGALAISTIWPIISWAATHLVPLLSK